MPPSFPVSLPALPPSWLELISRLIKIRKSDFKLDDHSAESWVTAVEFLNMLIYFLFDDPCDDFTLAEGEFSDLQFILEFFKFRLGEDGQGTVIVVDSP
jgi:hypothetical protein